MKRFSRAQQEQYRAMVLALDRQIPRPSNYKIAEIVGISPSTVRYILKGFRNRSGDLGDRCRRGRKLKCSKRYLRYKITIHLPYILMVTCMPVWELWAGVQEAWNEVPPSFVRGLYASVVRRLTAVVVAKGGNTKY